MASKEELPQYPQTEIPETNTTIYLLLRSTAPIDTINLTPDQISKINSAAVIAGQAGRECYSNLSPSPLDYITKSDKYRDTTDRIAESTRRAGHSSTREHVHYSFKIDGISRNAVYYLHSHPFYVSDMQSQRYCSFSETKPFIPHFENQEIDDKAAAAVKDLVDGYNQLYSLLMPTTKQLILERFPGKNSPIWEEKINEEAKKKAQEIARYLLPLGTPSNLYHTISELTLIRLYHQSQTMPVQPEMKKIIEGMVSVVSQVDPSILQEISIPLEADPVSPVVDISNFSDEFDALISGYPIKIDQIGVAPSTILARAVRATLGKSASSLPDPEALDLLLNPAKNKMLTFTTGDMVIDRLSQCLNQVNISALMTLSHVANEQFHRHRGFDHTEQVQFSIQDVERDIIIPTIFEKNQAALDLYLSLQKNHCQVLQELSQMGASPEKLQYLLTNATRIRKSINAPLGVIYHFLKLRTCLTAQEEIYHLAVSLTKQICDLDPALAKYFQYPSPCGLRHQAGVTPFCPEDHSCGVRIWNVSINDFPKRYI